MIGGMWGELRLRLRRMQLRLGRRAGSQGARWDALKRTPTFRSWRESGVGRDMEFGVGHRWCGALKIAVREWLRGCEGAYGVR